MQKVLLVAGSLAVTFVLIEAALRTFYPQSLYAVDYCYLGWCHVPNARFVHAGESREFVTRVEYNSRGLRDREYATAKPAGVQRVLVFGDSYVEALEVESDDTFVKRLERRLNETAPTRRFDVLNFGVSAYDTAQEWWYFKTEGVQYQPDLVVLVYAAEVGSPFAILVDGRPVFIEPRFGRLETIGRKLVTLLKSNFHTVNLVAAGLRLNRSVADLLRQWQQRPARMADAARQAGPARASEWDLQTAILADLDEAVRHVGGYLLVASTHTGPLETLRQELAARGVDLLLVDLQEVSDAEAAQHHFPIDGHYNEKGHAKVARILYETVARCHLLNLGNGSDRRRPACHSGLQSAFS